MTLNHDDGMLLSLVPHSKELDMRSHKSGGGKALISVPYHEHLVGDPDTGVIHGGVITTILDNGCGFAAMTHPELKGMVATLDLRIDYMRAAEPRKTVWADCECYRITRSVAFCRGVAYEEDPEDPIATAAGAFMITATKGREMLI